MTEGNTILLSLIVALSLVVIPEIHEAQAISSTALDRRNGVQGDFSSGGKRRGGGSDI